MNETFLNDQVFADFCKHLSASLNAVDLVRTTRAFESLTFDSTKDDPILLTAPDVQVVKHLHKLGYVEFLRECISRLRLLPSCSDIFLSEVDAETFVYFQKGFEHYGPNVEVELTERGFIIHLPALISDLILSVIARVHDEVLRNLEHFTVMIQAVGGDPSRFFLNAKSPTPESQYILFWLSWKLGVPATPTFETALVI